MVTNEFKVGDKVKFGAYGYFDMDKPYTIIEIKNTLNMLGGIVYMLEDEDGHTVTAYKDEIVKY